MSYKPLDDSQAQLLIQRAYLQGFRAGMVEAEKRASKAINSYFSSPSSEEMGDVPAETIASVGTVPASPKPKIDPFKLKYSKEFDTKEQALAAQREDKKPNHTKFRKSFRFMRGGINE